MDYSMNINLKLIKNKTKQNKKTLKIIAKTVKISGENIPVNICNLT